MHQHQPHKPAPMHQSQSQRYHIIGNTWVCTTSYHNCATQVPHKKDQPLRASEACELVTRGHSTAPAQPSHHITFGASLHQPNPLTTSQMHQIQPPNAHQVCSTITTFTWPPQLVVSFHISIFQQQKCGKKLPFFRMVQFSEKLVWGRSLLSPNFLTQRFKAGLRIF